MASGMKRRRRGRKTFVKRSRFTSTTSIKRVIRAAHEPKNVDISTSGTVSGTAYNIYLLNSALQGVTGNTRTGREILIDGVRVCMTLENSGVTSADLIRVLLVWDKETRGASPGLGDVLTNNTFGLSSLNSSYNFDNVPSRFTILMDKHVSLTPSVANSTLTAYNAPLSQHVWTAKVNKKVHYYNTSAGTVADIDSGGLFLFFLGGQASGNNSLFSLDTRVQFRDI